ncbi:MAG: Gfo/Idh/MocA family oxidoreductase [Proteobacteria bacterium]|nr:Gfo/Idh/MocA family oxidoreductase [Pseudomonadota bacterium]
MVGSGPLKLGVIGVGGRGRIARSLHRPDQSLFVVAGADPNRDALAQFRQELGDSAFVTEDYRQLLARDELDAVLVMSPDFLHEEHSVAALKLGKAVFVEKPMAVTIKGCDRMLDTARQHGSLLCVGHNMRQMSPVRRMKELIDADAIGEVKAGWCRHFISYGGDAYFKDWHADRTKSTSLLLQKAAHDIDVLHFLCGGRTVRVNAMGGLVVYHQVSDRHRPEEYGGPSKDLSEWPPLSLKGLNPVIDVEDISMMQMQLDNGVFCSYQQCHFTPDAWRNYTVIGTRGRIENFGDTPGNCVVRVWNRRGYYDPNGDQHYPISQDAGTRLGADQRTLQEFVRLIRGRGRPSMSPVSARNSVAAGFQATASLRAGGIPLEVPQVSQTNLDYFG